MAEKIKRNYIDYDYGIEVEEVVKMEEQGMREVLTELMSEEGTFTKKRVWEYIKERSVKVERSEEVVDYES